MKVLYSIYMIGFMALLGCTTEIIAPIGPSGQDGIDGVDGNANVQVSVHEVIWSTPDTVVWVAEILEANITLDILENGTVNVFLSNDKKNWLQIPFSFDSYQYLFWYNKGKVSLRAKNGGKMMPSARLYQFGKIVVMEGT